MNQLSTHILFKGFFILSLFSLISSSILPYYFVEKIGVEYLCDSTEDKDAEEKEENKEEKKEKIRDNIDNTAYSFSKKELKYYNFKNFHHAHFQEIETPPPEFFV